LVEAGEFFCIVAFAHRLELFKRVESVAVWKAYDD